MRKYKILWADDEIDLLKPHIFFLEDKGYEVVTVNSGQDAIESSQNEYFDIVFLDENMPGISGLEALSKIKEIKPNLPIIMITKSEDEGIMTDAIGRKIADYLIKPVNPHQILSSIKKNLHQTDIVTEATMEGYREEFGQIGSLINDSSSFDNWVDVYKKLVFWEIELTNTQNPLIEVLLSQKQDANNLFVKYVRNNYTNWIKDRKSVV